MILLEVNACMQNMQNWGGGGGGGPGPLGPILDPPLRDEPHRLDCSGNYSPCRWSCVVNEPHMGSCAVDIIVMSLIGWTVVEIIVLVGGAVL